MVSTSTAPAKSKFQALACRPLPSPKSNKKTLETDKDQAHLYYTIFGLPNGF